MKIYAKLIRVFILHWFYLTFGQTSKGISRCSAHATELMKEATVTCFFPDSVVNVDFTVYREEDKVAECTWKDGNLDCTFKSGYGEDNQTVTNSFTLRIPQLFQNHTGKYRCVVENYDEEKCTLFPRTGTSEEPAREQNVTTTQLVNSEAPSLPPPTSSKDLPNNLLNGTNVIVPGNYSLQSNGRAVVSSIPDDNAVNDNWKAVGAGVGAVVLLLVSAVAAIVFCRRRRRVIKKRSCLPLASPHTQTSQKYVYSSVPSDVENGGVKHEAEKSKLDDMRTPEVLQQVAEKTECRQVDEQVLHSVIELMKGFANSPGCSDSSTDTTDKAVMKTPNVKTKLLCRRGADGSFELSIENSVCSPDTFSQKEPVTPGQEADRLESPFRACALAHRDTDLRTSIDVQEQAIPDVHDVVRNSDRGNQRKQHTDSVDCKQASEIRLEDVRLEHSLSQTSFPREERQSSDSFADDTHDLTGKVEQMQQSPEDSKMTHEQCQCSGNTQHQFKADTTPDMPLSPHTAEKNDLENKIKSEDIAEAQSGSRVVNIKVRPGRV